MLTSGIKEGLICTNDNCVGCNRCISVCSCPGATIAAQSEDGKPVIRVDGSRCIACGACMDACEHHAREFRDDTMQFIQDLKAGEQISIMVAPAFMAIYPDEYREILGKLKALGVNRIFSVAYGADITTWAYLNYLNNNHITGSISQPCPALVDYIEKYIPELIPKLVPVQSPMMCMAIYAHKYLKVTDRLAFIGPCIAKKNEISSKRGQNLVSYSVTFDHLMKQLRQMDVQPQAYQDEDRYGLGSVYAMAGGLKENIHWFLGSDAFVRQVEGEKRLYTYLQNNKDRILQENSAYTLVDVLNCTDGCLCGTGVEDSNDRQEDTWVQIAKIKDNSKNSDSDSPWSRTLKPEERLNRLNEQFSELNIEDYYCEYEDKSETCAWKEPTDKELDIVFGNMNKNTAESRNVNCASCGYNTCRDMGKAIFNGFNHKENCVHFMKSVLEDISADYRAVLLIHEDNKSVHVVKYPGETATNSWLRAGLNLTSYDEAIRDYINLYVAESDRERVTAATEFTTLQHRLADSDHMAIVYMRQSETGDTGYFQMEFTRIAERNDIVLSFRDVDSDVRNDMESKDRLESALRDAEQASVAKSTFLANMSHEIRTPINAILGMDTMILRESNQDNVVEYAKNVKSAGNTLLALINDILDFSKIESGKMEIIEGNYRLDSVINDLMNMVRPKAEDKGLKLLLELQQDTPAQLIGDEVRVKQIILNILNNAVKYTKEGQVTLSVGYKETTAEEAVLHVAVSDTGIGIKADDISVLFSPYERLEENKNKLIEGTGLGLSITQNLLNKMGSSLDVDSVYGQGSTFSFLLRQKLWGSDRISQEHLKLPAAAAPDEDREQFHAPDAVILAVDDVGMNLVVLESLLKRLRIKPDTCLSGMEALEYAEKKHYDIIFLDAMMPGLSGEETLHELRKNCDINRDTPIIVLTANAIVGAREKYIEEGFSDYLSKPIDGRKLENLIQEYLPKDKIMEPSADTDPEPSISPEDQQLIKQLDSIEGIKSAAGIKAAGGEETYLSVSRNFYDTAAGRIGMIRDYFKAMDIENYTIQVHALKSSARLIGADNLSALALEMELAGKDDNKPKILEMTGELLATYENIVEKLGQVFESQDAEADLSKPELSYKKFRRRMSELSELADAFDFESVKELFGALSDYRIPSEGQEVYKELKAHIADVDRDGILLILKRFLEDKD